jgi:hypothetical protein
MELDMRQSVNRPEIVLGPFSECTDPPYCVQYAKLSNNEILITSSVPDHDGKISLEVTDFDNMCRTIAAAPAGEIFVFSASDPVQLEVDGEDTFLVGPSPDGGMSRIKFYHYELSDFYIGVRAGNVSDKLQLVAA